MGSFWFFTVETWALLLLLTGLLILYVSRPYSFFRKLGVPGPDPLPLFGNMLEYRKGFHALDMECFRKYGRIWGIYEGRAPVLCVLDRTIIKSVLVKEFYSLFTNRRDFGLNGELYDTLFSTKDKEWKRIRTALSPCFTSGRLKEMFGAMKMHSHTLIRNLEKTAELKRVVEVKQFLGGYTMDVITSSAFSIDNDSLNNPKEPFVANVKKLLDFDFFSPMLLIGALFPFTVPLLEKMNFAIISSSVVEFFFAILQKIKDERGTQDHKSRVDFMQLMVDSQTPEKAEAPEGEEITRGLSDHEIFSQSIFFILASYETSGTLSFFFYNLATNPEEMRKLQEEIDRTFPDEASVQYNAVMGLDYLDAAIKESMRLFPVAARLERVCKKTVEINGLTIPRGTIIIIPTLPLHRDPEYWPDPETFKPERFTKENKERIDPYVFMPFGSGPRNCIGMRFALVLMKLVIVQILRRFDVNVCDETKVPLEFGMHTFLSPKDPIKLKFTPRANTTSHCSES